MDMPSDESHTEATSETDTPPPIDELAVLREKKELSRAAERGMHRHPAQGIETLDETLKRLGINPDDSPTDT